MPRQVATLLCFAAIFLLLRLAREPGEKVSPARWVPFCWMFLAGSRFLSQWLSGLNLYRGGGSALGGAAEGSPIDMPAFLLLMVLSVGVLLQRKLSWARIVADNKALAVFYLFGFVSILWSESPGVALKRWLKSLGTVSMALVILTDRNPYKTYRQIITPLGIVLLLLSVLFIKYYPELGRSYHSTGTQMLTGVTTQKNSLGELCMLVGLYVSWNLLHIRRHDMGAGHRYRWPASACLLGTIAWLMALADSATALVCLAVGVAVHVLARIPIVARRPLRLVAVLAFVIGAYGVLQLTFDVNTVLLGLLNRRPDLTTRVPMWEDILSVAENPLIGFGWQSFSLTEQHRTIVAKWQVISTHNTYLDLYLNLGLIGLALYATLWATGLWNASRLLAKSYEEAVLRISFLVVVALYGWTETVDQGVNNTYLLFLFGMLDLPEHLGRPHGAKDGRVPIARPFEARSLSRPSVRRRRLGHPVGGRPSVEP